MTDKLRDRISLVPKDKKGRWKTLDIFQVTKEQALEIDNQQAEINRLRTVLDLYRDAVRIDVTMEGPKFMGANSSALKRAWDADLATLGDHNEKGN